MAASTGSRTRLGNDVAKALTEMNLEQIGPRLEALGVRGAQDLALVDDADLVRWGLSTIERRRFFGTLRGLLGEQDCGLLPPSALTTQKAKSTKVAGARARRPEVAAPARLDELLGKGSAEHQVPRLAERLLAATGPVDIAELSTRLARAAPALTQAYQDNEWPQFVEACIRGYGRLKIEDGVLAGDQCIVSISSSVLFSASEEVVTDIACWIRVVTCLGSPAEVAVCASLCRASREVSDGPMVWTKLLSRWYPKSTLLNPDWVTQSDLEKRLEDALNNDYTLAALTRRLSADEPYDIGDLLRAVPQQTTPKALIKFMSTRPDNFRQSPDGTQFCVCRNVEDLNQCKEWRTVNPFQTPPIPKCAISDAGAGSSTTATGGKPPPPGRPKEASKKSSVVSASSVSSGALKEQLANQADKEVADTPVRDVCQKLDPKVAFRLYHTGLLSQTTDQSKRGKLAAWEYFSESNSKCTMPPGDLLDLTESRVNAIRANDPAVVHELVSQTLEGLIYKVPFGFWNRRVRILTVGLQGSQLTIGRETKKKYERKLVEFMEWVKKERGFGFYHCETCGGRWKSGFSYEEITQSCIQCGTPNRPYRIVDLETKEAREAREKGDPPPEGSQGSTRKGAGKKGRNAVGRADEVKFSAPVLQHGEDSTSTGEPEPKRPRLDYGNMPGKSGKGKGKTWPGASGSSVVPPPVAAPAAGGYKPGGGGFFANAGPAAPQLSNSATAAAAAAAANAVLPASDTTPTPTPAAGRFTSGTGGFFAKRQAAAAQQNSQGGEPSASAASTSGTSATAPAVDSTAASEEAVPAYKPGGGGFFARRKAEGASSTPDAEAASTPASAPAAAPAPQAATAPSDAVAPSKVDEPKRAYAPGGGGFFGKKAGSSAAAAPAAAEAVPPAQGEATPAPTVVAAAPVPPKSTPTVTAMDVDTPAGIAPEKMEALRTLGLSIEEGVKMGLLPASALAGAAGKPKSAAATRREAEARLLADAAGHEGEAKPDDYMEDDEEEDAPAAGGRNEQRPGDARFAAQDAERRRLASARFTAKKDGGDVVMAGAAEEEGETNYAELIDLVSTVVTFPAHEATGRPRVLVPQASDAAYLVSETVFWPLLRRLAAEIAALETNAASLDSSWQGLPKDGDRTSVEQLIERRGYVLPPTPSAMTPQSMADAVVVKAWRRALLTEAASDLMTSRIKAGRGINAPALAGPPAGLAGAAALLENGGMMDKLVVDLATSNAVKESGTFVQRLKAVSDKVVAKGNAAGAETVAVLKGNWSLMQEMQVRECVDSLAKEYSVRRRILLMRLDQTVQSMCGCAKASQPAVRANIGEVLSQMWGGWRGGGGVVAGEAVVAARAEEAPRLSEWNVLAVTNSVLQEVKSTRVSELNPYAPRSALKSVRIGDVPGRGGVPEGYVGDSKKNEAAPVAAPAKVTSSVATLESTATSAATATVKGRARKRARPASQFISGTDASASGSTEAAPQGDATISEKKGEKFKTVSGARSGNADMKKAHHQKLKEEREAGGVKKSYHDELLENRT